MIKELLYTELEAEYDKAPRPKPNIYMWVHEYCNKYLKNHKEVTEVKLTLDGNTHSNMMSGKVYEFKKNPSEVLQVNEWRED